MSAINELRKTLVDHVVADEERFDRIERTLASASGRLNLLIALVVASGALTVLHGA